MTSSAQTMSTFYSGPFNRDLGSPIKKSKLKKKKTLKVAGGE